MWRTPRCQSASTTAFTTAGGTPDGMEYIVPLCKTGGGSFMILDFDGTPNNCADEVANPPHLQFPSFPVDLNSDNGNNCAKPMADAVNALTGDDKTVMIPICDNNECNTDGGSHATYHISGVVAFTVFASIVDRAPNFEGHDPRARQFDCPLQSTGSGGRGVRHA